jgi:hypothetical protein
MIAQRLIEDARAAGLSMEVDGGDLIVEADRDPPPELLAELREHKAELIELLKPTPPAPGSAVQDTSDNLSFAEETAERAAIVECEAGIPRRWAEGFAALATMPVPSGFAPERWRRVIDAVGKFLDRWSAEAIRCGWSDLDLFGINPDRPDARFDATGLTLSLDRCEVVSIDDEGADLVTETGARQRYRRRELPFDTVNIWDLMIVERGSDAG